MVTALLLSALLVWATVGGALLAWHAERSSHPDLPDYALVIGYGPCLWLIIAAVGIKEAWQYINRELRK